MTAVQEVPNAPIPVAEIHVDELAATKQQLIRALFALANNNHHFRRGQSDCVSVALEEAGRVDDIDRPGTFEEVDYIFSARRQRKPGYRPAVSFEFALINRLTNVPLPGHLANEMGFNDDHKAPDGSRPVLDRSVTSDFTHQAELRFKLCTDDRFLTKEESYTYFDKDDDGIIETKNSNAPDPGEEAEFSALDQIHKSPFELVDEDETRAFEAMFSALEAELDDEGSHEQRDIALAYGVLARIKRALLIQAGVKVARVSLLKIMEAK
jgi:hypothetical protein